MDGEPILKKTLLTVAAMVGATVAFVGTISIVAVVVTSHVVGGSDSSSSSDNAAVTEPPSGARVPGAPPGRARPANSKQSI